MDTLTLIEQARSAGLTLAVRDGELIVRGPKSAAPLVQALRERKAEVIAALSAPETRQGESWKASGNSENSANDPPESGPVAPAPDFTNSPNSPNGHRTPQEPPTVRPIWAILPGVKVVPVAPGSQIPPDA